MLRKLYLGTLGASVGVVLSILSCTSADSQALTKPEVSADMASQLSGEVSLMAPQERIFLESLVWVTEKYQSFVRAPWRAHSRMTHAKAWTDDVAWVHVTFELSVCDKDSCEKPRYLNLKMPRSSEVAKEIQIKIVMEDNDIEESTLPIGENFQWGQPLNPGQILVASPKLLKGLSVLSDVVYDFGYFVRASFSAHHLEPIHSLLFSSNPVEWKFTSRVDGPTEYVLSWGFNNHWCQLHANYFENEEKDQNLSYIDVSLNINDSWIKKSTKYIGKD